MRLPAVPRVYTPLADIPAEDVFEVQCRVGEEEYKSYGVYGCEYDEKDYTDDEDEEGGMPPNIPPQCAQQ